MVAALYVPFCHVGYQPFTFCTDRVPRRSLQPRDFLSFPLQKNALIIQISAISNV